MSETYTVPAMAGYRKAVRERLEAGETFDEVESAIDELADLSEDQRAALWLFAFAKRDASGRRPPRRAHMTISS